MAKISKEFKPLAKRLVALGYELDLKGSHVRVRMKGNLIGVMPTSTSDPHRGLKNCIAKLKRQGVPL